MKRNERITSSWGFLTQGAKAALCLLVLMLSVQTVFAQQFEYGGVVYNLSGGKATATKFGKEVAPPTLVIPDYVYYNHQPYPVTAIAAGAFSQSKAYRKLVIGDNVTSIGKKAFEHFGEAGGEDHVLIIGTGLTSLEAQAFEHFAEHPKKSNRNKVILRIDDPAKIKDNSFQHCKQTTFYVKDEPTFDKFKNSAVWSKYNNKYPENTYEYPIPADLTLSANKWQTAVFPENLSVKQVETYFGEGTLLAEMSTAKPEVVNGESGNYLVRFEPVTTVKANSPMLIRPGMKDVRYTSDISYGITDYSANPVVSAEHNSDGITVRMIGVCDADHLLTDGQIYFRNYGDGNMRFFMYKEGDGAPVMVKRGKCIWAIVDGGGNVVTNKALDYKIDDAATAIEDVTRKPAAQDGRIYSLTGQYEGTSLEELPKGIHIMNGRKFVVK